MTHVLPTHTPSTHIHVHQPTDTPRVLSSATENTTVKIVSKICVFSGQAERLVLFARQAGKTINPAAAMHAARTAKRIDVYSADDMMERGASSQRTFPTCSLFTPFFKKGSINNINYNLSLRILAGMGGPIDSCSPFR